MHGIIATDKKPFCVPMERYGVLMDEVPITKEMKVLKDSVKEKNFQQKSIPW